MPDFFMVFKVDSHPYSLDKEQHSLSGPGILSPIFSDEEPKDEI